MRAAHQGSTKSEETRRKISEANKGKVLPPEAIERRKKTIAKMIADGTLVPAMKGKHHSEETKKMLSEKAIERESKVPKEIKTQQGHVLNATRKITELTRQKHRENWRAKAHKADGAWWTSQSEDSMAAALDKRGIRYLRQHFIPEIQNDPRGRYHAFDFWLTDRNILLGLVDGGPGRQDPRGDAGGADEEGRRDRRSRPDPRVCRNSMPLQEQASDRRGPRLDRLEPDSVRRLR